jgi:hypothetical protein
MDITVRFEFQPGQDVLTPFGPGVIDSCNLNRTKGIEYFVMIIAQERRFWLAEASLSAL